MRVTVWGVGLPMITLGSGERLLFGRAPSTEPDLATLDVDTLDAELRSVSLVLDHSGPNVSRLLGELVVGTEAVRLIWYGKPQGKLSSLFDSPGGARSVTLREDAFAVLDDGDNEILVLRGRQDRGGHSDPASYDDLLIAISVDTGVDPFARDSFIRAVALSDLPASSTPSADGAPVGMRTSALPDLPPGSDTWYVALALAKPWLTNENYPRPLTNREITDQVTVWRGDAGKLADFRRVHEAIKKVADLAFGRRSPFGTTKGTHQVRNARDAVGKRAAEVELVTSTQLDQVERRARSQ